MRSRILHNIKASGNYWPASEKPSGWHFAGGPIVAHDGMLAGYVSVDAYIEQGERAAKAQANVCIHAVSPDALLFSNA